MLNVCMERRNLREGKLPFAMQMLAQQIESEAGPSSMGKADSDDEFFDCDEDRVVDDDGNNFKTLNVFKILTNNFLETAPWKSPWNPVGRISKLGKMLLIDADEPLYIPVTQDPGIIL